MIVYDTITGKRIFLCIHFLIFMIFTTRSKWIKQRLETRMISLKNINTNLKLLNLNNHNKNNFTNFIGFNGSILYKTTQQKMKYSIKFDIISQNGLYS